MKTLGSLLSVRLIVWLLLSLYLFGCSSAPKLSEEVTKSRRKAVEFSGYGNNYFNQGLYEKALEMYDLAFAYNASVDHQPGMVQSYNSIGKTYLVLGEFQKAEASFKEGYELAMDLADPGLIVQCLNHRGELHLYRSDYEASLVEFERALESSERGVSDSERAVLFHNLGTVYKRLGRREESQEYLIRALQLNRRTKNSEELATNYYMLASLSSEAGEYEKALEYANLALENDKKVENSIGIAKDCQAIGLILRRMGQNEEAFVQFRRSILVYRSLALLHSGLKLQDEVKAVLKNLIETARLTGRTEEAEFYSRILSGQEE